MEVNRLWAHGWAAALELFDKPAGQCAVIGCHGRICAERIDCRHVLRTIPNSRTYQAQSTRNAFNKDDRKYFSHYQPRMLSAEQPLDAIGEVTGSERIGGLPDMKCRGPLRAGIGEIDFLKVFNSLSGNPPANVNVPMTPA